MLSEKPRLTLQEKIKKTQEDINRELKILLPTEENDPSGLNLAKSIRYAILGSGKRIRAFLVLEVSRLFNVEEHSALRTACALELTHTFSLVHDDLPSMDNAHLRRGKPSVHVAFGEALAILAGDSMLTLSFEILAEVETYADPKVRADLVLTLAKAVGPNGMCAGQTIDLSTENIDLDIATIIRLQRLKTGCLLEASCLMGTILGHAPKEAKVALQGYAHDLGLAYQITDDLLDAEGSIDEIGKPVGTDVMLGKSNLVTLIGIEKAREHAKMLVNQAIAHLDYFDDNAHYLKELARHILSRRS